MECPYCGKEIEEGTIICPGCFRLIADRKAKRIKADNSPDTEAECNQDAITPFDAGRQRLYMRSTISEKERIKKILQEEQMQKAGAEYGNKEKGNEDKPIGVHTYLMLMVVFSIPIIGLIVNIVVAAKAKRKSLKNFSLAYMVMMVLIGSVLIFIAIGIYTSIGNGIIKKGIFPQIMQAGDRFKNIEMAEKMKIWQ